MSELNQIFESERPRLQRIGYRMLGTVSEAEDLVQETWLRWNGADAEAIHTPTSWLSTTMTRLCIDYLRSARVRREQYVGPWLPEPVITDDASGIEEHTDLAKHLSTALLMILERLTPTERAAFLLREVFDYGYDEVADVLGTNISHCRQLVSRAKNHISQERPRFEVSAQRQKDLVSSFSKATIEGDMQTLLALFDQDITMYSDGGGKVTAARRPVYGADKVARFFVGISRKQPQDLMIQVQQINGEPGLVGRSEGRVIFTMAFTHGPEGFTAIHIVNNPDKLKYITAQKIGY